jgi:hypothetical protein
MTTPIIIDLLTAEAMTRVPAGTDYMAVRTAVTTELGALYSRVQDKFDTPAVPERRAPSDGPRVAFQRIDESAIALFENPSPRK